MPRTGNPALNDIPAEDRKKRSVKANELSQIRRKQKSLQRQALARELLAQGKSVPEIATLLKIHHQTVYRLLSQKT